MRSGHSEIPNFKGSILLDSGTMIPTISLRIIYGFWLCLHFTTKGLASTKFSSHVSISTPARSFTHGVGNPVPVRDSIVGTERQPQILLRSYSQSSKSLQQRGRGYVRVKPSIPFTIEDRPRSVSIGSSTWQSNDLTEQAIPILPASPYKVDSPDPESLWPEGLFLPPMSPPRFKSTFRRRSDTEPEFFDPYLVEGAEAITAVKRADTHGHLFFHDIPHIESLLSNQELRTKNHLRPHRIASIRHTWPYNRP